MASMQELANRKKQIMQQFINQEQMRAYENSKKKANNVGALYGISSKLGRIGQDLSGSQNKFAQTVGKAMYKYSPASLEDKTVNGVKSIADKVFASKGVPTGMETNVADLAKTAGTLKDTANTVSTAKDVANTANTAKDVVNTANTAKDVASTASTASNALSTAGSVAGGALGALNVGSDIAQKKYDDAVIDGASTIAAFIPGGAIVSGALQLGKFIKNAIKDKQDKKAQEMQAKSEKAVAERKLDTQENMQNITEAGQAPSASPEELKQSLNTQVLNPQQEAPAPLTKEDYNAWKEKLNPQDFQTSLTPQEVQQFSDWAAKTNAPISNDYDMQGYWKNEVAPYEALATQGYTPEQIAGARQGLNGGDAVLAKFIQEQGINTPGTASEIALAKQGKLNALPYDEATQHYTDKYKTPLHEYFSNESIYATGDNARYAGKWEGEDFITPYKDKANTVKEILAQIQEGYEGDDTSSGWNKVGKGADIARAILSNPALQGTVAGLAYGKYKDDAMEGLKYGIDFATNKQKSNYYSEAMGKKPGILGNYDADDYKAKVTADHYARRNEIYDKNVISQINHRLVQEGISWKELERKIAQNEFSNDLALKKYGLSVEQLKEVVKHHRISESQGAQRIGIQKNRLNLDEKKFAHQQKNKNNKPMSSIALQEKLWEIDDSDLDEDEKIARKEALLNLNLLESEDDPAEDLW